MPLDHFPPDKDPRGVTLPPIQRAAAGILPPAQLPRRSPATSLPRPLPGLRRSDGPRDVRRLRQNPLERSLAPLPPPPLRRQNPPRRPPPLGLLAILHPHPLEQTPLGPPRRPLRNHPLDRHRIRLPAHRPF